MASLLVWNMSDEASDRVIEWAFQQWSARRGHLAFAWAQSILVASVFPHDGPVHRWGSSLRALAFVVIASARRVQDALQHRHPPRWACRAAWLLPLGWLASFLRRGGRALRNVLHE